MDPLEWKEGVSGWIPNSHIASSSLLGTKHRSCLLPIGGSMQGPLRLKNHVTGIRIPQMQICQLMSWLRASCRPRCQVLAHGLCETMFTWPSFSRQDSRKREHALLWFQKAVFPKVRGGSHNRYQALIATRLGWRNSQREWGMAWRLGLFESGKRREHLWYPVLH